MPPSDRKKSGDPGKVASPLVLLSKTDALGDQILATGLVRALRLSQPEARIVWIVREGNEALAGLLAGARALVPDLDGQPARQARRLRDIDDVTGEPWNRVTMVPVPVNPYHPQSAGLAGTLRWLGRFVYRLRPTVALVGSTTRNWLDQFIVASSRAPSRIGFGPSFGSQDIPSDPAGLIPGKFTRLTREISFPETADERDRLCLLAEASGARTADCVPGIDPLEEARPVAIRGLGHSLVIAPGVGDSRRRVPAAVLAEAAGQFLRGNVELENCLVVEGPLDREIANEVTRHLRSAGLRVRRFRFDRTGLPALVSVLRSAPLFLTHETFYAQLSALLGTPTVALWGLGHWKRFFPRQGRMTIVHTTMPCSGCEWNCVFDRWKCIADLPPDAIAGGLRQEWEDRADLGIQYLNTQPPIPDDEVNRAIRRTWIDASRFRKENLNLRKWMEDLQHRTGDLESWGREETARREQMEKLHEEAAGQREQNRVWAEEEKRLRLRAQELLSEAGHHRDALESALRQETRIRREAERLLQEAEAQRETLRSWAEEERLLRTESERLLRETEKQREDARAHAAEEARLRQLAESLLRETEKLREDNRRWAEEERRLRELAESLRADAEKQRDDAVHVASEERRLRELAESLRMEAEAQRDAAREWAETEKHLREESDSLRIETEQQRDTALAWAHEERALREQIEELLAQAEKQRSDAQTWANEEKRIRENTESALAETARQCDGLRSWAEQEKALRDEAVALREDAEGQRDDAVAWAREEQRIRLEVERVLSEAEKQRDDARHWAREEQRIRATLERVLSESETQRDDARHWAEEERRLRDGVEADLENSRNLADSLKQSLEQTRDKVNRLTSELAAQNQRLAETRDALERMTGNRDRYERLAACRLALRMAERLHRLSRKSTPT